VFINSAETPKSASLTDPVFYIKTFAAFISLCIFLFLCIYSSAFKTYSKTLAIWFSLNKIRQLECSFESVHDIEYTAMLAKLHNQPKKVIFNIRAVILDNVLGLTFLENRDFPSQIGDVTLDGEDLDCH
jgi:hypothetical protein